MPVPIICLDEHLRHFAQRFRKLLSKPQYQYFLTVLLGLMLCEGARTLRGLVRQIADGPSLAGLSRDLAEAPWEATAVAEQWLRHFREMMQPVVAAEQERQHQAQAKRRGRPKPPVVTGYLIGDDSTMHKRKAKKMEELGLHHSTTQDKRALSPRRGGRCRRPAEKPYATASLPAPVDSPYRSRVPKLFYLH